MDFSTITKYLEVPTSKRNTADIWINDDIRPLPPSRRKWDRLAFVSFWAINQICLSNWQLGSSLVALGLSVWQAMIAVIIGKIIIAVVAVFNGYVGAEWHIGFPVVSRYIWGIYGQYLALIQRILLSLVWFSVQSYTGGLCVEAILASLFPSYQNMGDVFPASANLTMKQFIGWIIFNLLMIPLLYIPPEKLRRTLLVMNTVSVITLICMMIWALHAAHGAGPLLTSPATTQSSSELAWAIVSGITSVVGNIAVGLTNQMDYSRFARHPGDQVFGQYFSITFFGVIMPLFGCLASSATQGIYGEAIWNPPNIAIRWLDDSYTSGSRAAAFFAGIGLVTCQLAINSVDNAFSTGMDASGLFPRFINIRRGAYIGLVISCAMCPWELMSKAATFISVLSAYSVFLGPWIGIMICDYWVLRSRRVKLSDLFHPGKEGIYYYTHGINWRAFVSWVLGWASQIPGFAHEINSSIKVPVGCTYLYYLAFPLGFSISFLIFFILNKIWPPIGVGEIDAKDLFGTFTREEALKLGIEPGDDADSAEAIGVIEGVDGQNGDSKGGNLGESIKKIA